MLIYKTSNGRIIANIPDGQPFHYLGDEDLVTLKIKNIPQDWYNYKVVNNKLVKMSEREIDEIFKYGRILSKQERFENEMLNKLIPSHEEIKKAEQTIEILTLIQEVM